MMPKFLVFPCESPPKDCSTLEPFLDFFFCQMLEYGNIAGTCKEEQWPCIVIQIPSYLFCKNSILMKQN